MNSAAIWYGSPKSGKTRTLTKAFKGSNYFFLDFDNNYEEMQKSIEDNGGNYFSQNNAYDLLNQLLTGTITDQVVIIDALNDVKTYMLIQRIKQIREEAIGAEAKIDIKYQIKELTNTLSSGKIGNMQEQTSTWFKNTIAIMINNSNSINFIHHTTESGTLVKMEGNRAAYMSKFDITYKIMKEVGKESYFELEEQRSNISPKTVSLNRTKEDAVEYLTQLFNEFVPEGLNYVTGTIMRDKIRGKRRSWMMKMDWSELRDNTFEAIKDGRKTNYKLRIVLDGVAPY